MQNISWSWHTLSQLPSLKKIDIIITMFSPNWYWMYFNLIVITLSEIRWIRRTVTQTWIDKLPWNLNLPSNLPSNLHVFFLIFSFWGNRIRPEQSARLQSSRWGIYFLALLCKCSISSLFPSFWNITLILEFLLKKI